MAKQLKTTEIQNDRASQEKAVFDKPVRAQRGDIHKVTVQGVDIEFTDKYLEAQKAYKEAVGLPKVWHKLTREGGVVCMGAQYI